MVYAVRHDGRPFIRRLIRTLRPVIERRKLPMTKLSGDIAEHLVLGTPPLRTILFSRPWVMARRDICPVRDISLPTPGVV